MIPGLSDSLPQVLNTVFRHTFEKQEVKSIKNWMNHMRQRSFIKIDGILSQLPSSPLEPLIIRIHKLDNIVDVISHLEPDQRGATHLQLNATLVYLEPPPPPPAKASKKQPLQKGKVHFFGRTYQSKPLEIQRFEGNRFSLKRPHYLYMHTGHDTQNIGLVLEVILSHYSKTDNVVTDMTGVGWCLIRNILQIEQNKPQALMKGTPRLLLSNPDIDMIRGHTDTSSVVYSVSRQRNFEVPVVQPYTLIGPDDRVPGIKDHVMPIEITPQTQARLAPTTSLFIKNGSIMVSYDLEKELIKTVEKQRQALMQDHQQKTVVDSKDKVLIAERRLIVAAHNTWSFVNLNKGKNFISLSEPDPQTNVCKLAGVLKIENVVVDTDIALIFKVEYTLRVVGSDNLYFTFVLGWFIHIPTITRDGIWLDKTLDTRFIMGPGVTVTGDLLWEPNPSNHIVQKNASFLHLRADITNSGEYVEGDPGLVQMQSQMMQSQMMPSGRGTMNSDRGQDKEQTKKLLQLAYRQDERLRQKDMEINRLKHMVEKRDKGIAQDKDRMIQQMNLQNQILAEGKAGIDKAYLGQYSGGSSLPTSLPYQSLRPKVEMEPVIHQEIPGAVIKESKPTHHQIAMPQTVAPSAFQDSYNMFRPLEPRDIAAFADAGITGVGTGEQPLIVKGATPLLELEKKDPNKGSRFVIRLLAYRPSAHLQSFPRFLFFTFKFFDKPETKTAVAGVTGTDLQPGVSYALKSAASEAADGSLIHTFEIDPSKEFKVNERFTQYLLDKQLCIEAWDAQSLNYIGICQILLRDWLRQGKQMVTLGREYPLFDPSTREQKGGLSVELTNHGRSVMTLEEQVHQDEEVAMDGYRLKKDGTRSKTKKKIKSRPMNLADPKYRDMEAPQILGLLDPNALELPEELRKRERVEQYRRATGQDVGMSKYLTDPSQPDAMKERALRELQRFKEEKVKPYVISQMLRSKLTNALILPVQAGKTSYYIHTLRNPMIKNTNFDVKIFDSGLANTLELVKEPEEWKYLCQQLGFPTPPSTYSLITSYNTVHLKRGEQVPLVFKYLTDGEDPLSMKRRVVSVKIFEKDAALVSKFQLEIDPHDATVDKVYRLNENQNTNVDVLLPWSPPPVPHPNKLLLTCNRHQVKLAHDTNRMLLKLSLRTGSQRLREEEILVFVYADPYYAVLLQTLRVSLRLFRSLDVLAKAGQSRRITLDYYNDTNRRIQLYSSHDQLTRFIDPDRSEIIEPKPLVVVASDNFRCWVDIRAYASTEKRVLISAVDVQTRELVHGWLLKLIIQPCQIYSEAVVDLRGGGSKTQKFQFRNPQARQAYYFANSSEERFMRVVRQSAQGLLLAKNQVGQFILHFPTPDTGEKEVEVLIFISDKEESFHQARLLKVLH